jgi:hypothetical protein
MKNIIFLALFLILVFCACKGQDATSSKSTAGQDVSSGPAVVPADSGAVRSKPLPPGPTPPVFVEGMASVPPLDAWMDEVRAAEGNYTNKIQTIERGAEKHKVMIFSDPAGKVRMVRADISGKKPSTLEFFLNGGKVVLMREFLPGEHPTENRFYNRQDGQLMDCKSRIITSGMVADSIPFKPYISKYGFEDFRLKPAYVQKWLDDYLIGK